MIARLLISECNQWITRITRITRRAGRRPATAATARGTVVARPNWIQSAHRPARLWRGADDAAQVVSRPADLAALHHFLVAVHVPGPLGNLQVPVILDRDSIVPL